jgi:hypothetical protein
MAMLNCTMSLDVQTGGRQKSGFLVFQFCDVAEVVIVHKMI